MIKKISYVIANDTNPYENLATEAQLLEIVAEDECILYLWQNQRTVVIGHNQNCYKECRLAELANDGGFLARRLSGGGAVFHDAGNLNFTFLVQKANYDVERQLMVILQAVNQLGIAAVKSGRNDLTVAGRKFSGNAFYHSGKYHYHHGTILVNADMAQLSHYLQVSPAKLKAKGVASVRSRVANLCDFNSTITIDNTKAALLAAFSRVYGLSAQECLKERLLADRHRELVQKFSAADWLYGKNIDFTCEYEQRFAWGDIQLQLQVSSGKIKAAACYSDALDAAFISKIPLALQECDFLIKAMSAQLQLIADTVTRQEMVNNINLMLSGDGAEAV